MVAYAKPNLPLAPGVVDEIAEFIHTAPAAFRVCGKRADFSHDPARE